MLLTIVLEGKIIFLLETIISNKCLAHMCFSFVIDVLINLLTIERLLGLIHLMTGSNVELCTHSSVMFITSVSGTIVSPTLSRSCIAACVLSLLSNNCFKLFFLGVCMSFSREVSYIMRSIIIFLIGMVVLRSKSIFLFFERIFCCSSSDDEWNIVYSHCK